MGVYGRGTGSHRPSGRVNVRSEARYALLEWEWWVWVSFIHVRERPLVAVGSGYSKTSLFVLWFTSLVLCRRSVVKPKPEKALGVSFDSAWAVDRRDWVM